MHQVVDITPSPRVLRMLGQIDFKPWQCLAELIDNSIDSFIDQMHDGRPNPNPRITIDLPNDGSLVNGNAQIIIKDNGTGMTLDQLQRAIKAGYSGNDPVEKMGLFGMGFNISTARLGRRTEVWTTTSDSGSWIGVEIDFEKLEKQETFEVPVFTREKTEQELQANIHGTEIKLEKLEPERIRPLIWGAGKSSTKSRLGKIYGRIMSSLGITIIYSGDEIKPWSHCTWAAHRSVDTPKFGRVPARITINEELPPRKYCTTCWVWLNTNEDVCPACGRNDKVIERHRRIKGWIGIQRYFDKNHYGFDLIRNGRVIQELDKSLFDFVTENDERVLEYPIDATHWGGRIVGELEIDFVRVTHQKDAFDKLDPEWKNVVEIVRGNSPLRPQIAERMHLPPNDSPLAKLFAGYRSGYAGLQDLVPGDAEGKGLNSGLVQEYKDRYYAGEAEYQSDEKLYELVLLAEVAKRGGSTGGLDAGGEIPVPPNRRGSGSGENDQSDRGSQVESPIPIFEKDRSLSQTYSLIHAGNEYAVNVTAKKSMEKNSPYPITTRVFGSNFEFVYFPFHSMFEESLDSPVDFFLTELAQWFQTISASSISEWPISLIERELREKYFLETATSISRIADFANSLFQELQAHLDEELPGKAPIDIALFDESIRTKIQRQLIQLNLGDQEFFVQILRNGQFVKYVDNDYLLFIISCWPDLVMDGTFFSNPYSGLSPELQKEALRMLIFGLEDVLWISDEGRNAISKDNAWRLKFARALASMNLILNWRNE